MTTEELNFNLFAKMTNEMRDFYEWLKTQPAEEIISHSYEYAVKFDILSGIEEINFSEERARALLSLATPLDDIYKAYDDQGLTLIDLMIETAENRADEIIEQHAANAEVGVYPHSEAYAEENGEWEKYQQSTHLNIQCKEAIEAAIAQHYNYKQLDSEAVRQVAEQFGVHRVRFVLVNTLLEKDDDHRLAPEYKAWAKSVPVFPDRDEQGSNNRTHYVVNSHPGLVNAFIQALHREYPIPGIETKKQSVKAKLRVKPKKISGKIRHIPPKEKER